jgi:hypothetical protein
VALNSLTLANLISQKLVDAGFPVVDSGLKDDVLIAISEAIVEHITSSAVVTTNVPGAGLVAPSGGVTGAATGTGTVS